MVLGIKKVKGSVVGILDNGTVMTYDEKTECELKAKGVKVLRVGKVKAL
jgi:hypothetical protein